jgi:hypothetical protein
MPFHAVCLPDGLMPPSGNGRPVVWDVVNVVGLSLSARIGAC